MIKGDLVLVKNITGWIDFEAYVGFWDTIECGVITLKNARRVIDKLECYPPCYPPRVSKLFIQNGVTKNMDYEFGKLIEKITVYCKTLKESVIKFTDKAANSILDTYDWYDAFDEDGNCDDNFDWYDYDYGIENKVLIRAKNGVYEGFAVDTSDGITLLRGRHAYVPISAELTDIIQPIISDPYLYEKGPLHKNNIVIKDIEECVYYKDYKMKAENE